MLTLVAEKREKFGKKLQNRRKAGKLPVVVYGPKVKSTPLFVSTSDFKKLWQNAGESTIISLEMSGGGHDVLIHDVSFHPVSGEPLHADFYALDTSKPIRVKVPLHFEGVAPAVKNLGGVLVKVLHEVEIEVLPKELPHNLTVDISGLSELESHLSAKEIKLPASAGLITGPEEIVVIVETPKEEEIEEAPVDLSAIEVEKKGKTEEEGASGEAPEKEKPGSPKPTKEDKK